MKRLIAFLSLMFLFSSTVHAAVNSAHPRIWIDGPSGTVMSRLIAAKNANSPEWAALKAWGDANVGANLADTYEYGDWINYLMRYALLYQATGNQTYGNEGVVYLLHLIRDKASTSCSTGQQGATAIQCDSGYVARNIGVGAAIGRDWLDGTSSLTTSIINECATRESDWITWYNASGYARSDIQNNYWAGYFGMVYTSAIALFGDANYQPSWMAQAESMWTSNLLPVLNGVYQKGDDWGEGWNYAPQAMRLDIGYPMALQTGTTNNNHWSETNFAAALVQSNINMLYPARNYFSDDGVWSGSYKGDPRTALMMVVSNLAGFGGVDSTIAGKAKWFTQSITTEPNAPDMWQKFLWTDSAVTAVAPTISNMGGLTYDMVGHIVTRGADWSDTTTTFVDVNGRGTSYIAENSRNVGEVKIGSRGAELLVDGSTYETDSIYRNVPRITGTHTYAPYQEWWHNAVSTVASDVSNSTVFKVSRIDNAYDGNNDNTPSAASYTRNIVYSRPNFIVIYDNLVTTSYPTNQAVYQWYLTGTPITSSGIAKTTSGSANLFMKPLDASASITSNVNTGSRSGVRRIDVTPSTTTTDARMVTVFETAPSTQSSMTTSSEISTTSLKGVMISSTVPQVIIFSKDGTQQTAVAYTAAYSSGTTGNHLLVDIAPATYDIYRDGTKIITGAVASSQGVLSFSATGGTLYQIVKTGGKPVDPASALKGQWN